MGLAIGAGTDIAMDFAEVILTGDSLSNILTFLDLTKATHDKIVQNIWWGAGYNLIPVAAGFLAPIGFLLDPAVGALLMPLSTIIVAVNAMRLRLKK